MTFYFSFCASETDIMACGACKYDCCFAKFFAPEDAEMFGKLKLHFPVTFMRERLSDVSTTKEYKKQCVQEWKARVNAKGKEKQAGSSSSNELVCKDTCLFIDLFPPGAKEIIVEQGMEWVEAELKPKLEELWREIDEVRVAQIMLDFKNNGDQQ